MPQQLAEIHNLVWHNCVMGNAKLLVMYYIKHNLNVTAANS